MLLWVGHKCTGVYVVDVGAKIFEKFNPRDGTVVVGVNDIEYVLHLSTTKTTIVVLVLFVVVVDHRRRNASTRIDTHRHTHQKYRATYSGSTRVLLMNLHGHMQKSRNFLVPS